MAALPTSIMSGKGGSEEGTSSSCCCGARSHRARMAVGGCHGCHTTRSACGDCGSTPPRILPTFPGCCTCPLLWRTSARAFFPLPVLQARGAVSIFPRVQEGQRLFPVVLIGLQLPQIASRQESLHYPLHLTPCLAHSLAGTVPSWWDPGGLPSVLPSWTPLEACVCESSPPPTHHCRGSQKPLPPALLHGAAHPSASVLCTSPGMSHCPCQGGGTNGHGWEKVAETV